jgi:hypothetical protein
MTPLYIAKIANIITVQYAEFAIDVDVKYTEIIINPDELDKQQQKEKI